MMSACFLSVHAVRCWACTLGLQAGVIVCEGTVVPTVSLLFCLLTILLGVYASSSKGHLELQLNLKPYCLYLRSKT